MNADEELDRALARHALAADREPPSAGFESRLLFLATAGEPEPQRRSRGAPRVLAAVAACLLVAGAMAGYGVRLARHLPQPAAAGRVPAAVPPAASPQPASSTSLSYDVPPAAGRGSHQLVRVDWSGAVLDRRTLPASPAGKGWFPASMAPDGAHVLVRDDRAGLVMQAADGSSVPGDFSRFGTWADDSRHGCWTSGGAIQVSDLVDGAPRQGLTPITGGIALEFGQVIGCSPAADRAVIMGEASAPAHGPGGTYLVEVVQLSTGRVVRQSQYGEAPLDTVTSLDTRYLAEWDPATPLQTAIRDLAIDRIVGHVSGLVRGFSGDDSLAVVVDPESGTVRLTDWRSGAVLWRQAATDASATPRPGVREVAIALQQTPPGTGDVVIVDAGGRSISVARGVDLLGSTWHPDAFGVG